MSVPGRVWACLALAGCTAETVAPGRGGVSGLGQVTAGHLVEVFDSQRNYRRAAYDGRGRMEEVGLSVAGGTLHQTRTEYDEADRVVAVTYPEVNGSRLRVAYGYNARGLPATVDGGGVSASLTYTDLGQQKTIAYGNGIVATSEYYDSGQRHRLRTQTTAGGRIMEGRAAPPRGSSEPDLAFPLVLEQQEYQYDALGNLRTQKIDRDGRQVAHRSFSYDVVERLQEAQNVVGMQGQAWHSYTYDAVGNLLSHTSNGATTQNVYADPRHAHAVSSSGGRPFVYDNNGNLTNVSTGRRIEYNEDNYPKVIRDSGAVIATYSYDGDNNRLTRTDRQGKVTTYLGMQVRETLEDSEVVTHYVDVAGTRIAEIKNGAIRYYTHDLLGSTTLVTDSSGAVITAGSYDYEPFGRITTGSTSSTRYTYTGQEYEEPTGYYDYHARLYDPALGRFISPDSVVPDPTNPQALNRYSYVYNNPLRYTDPTGHWPTLPRFRTVADMIAYSNRVGIAYGAIGYSRQTRLDCIARTRGALIAMGLPTPKLYTGPELIASMRGEPYEDPNALPVGVKRSKGYVRIVATNETEFKALFSEHVATTLSERGSVWLGAINCTRSDLRGGHTALVAQDAQGEFVELRTSSFIDSYDRMPGRTASFNWGTTYYFQGSWPTEGTRLVMELHRTALESGIQQEIMLVPDPDP